MTFCVLVFDLDQAGACASADRLENVSPSPIVLRPVRACGCTCATRYPTMAP